MSIVIWSQWDDLEVPSNVKRLSPSNTDLLTAAEADLAEITFYVPAYMGGKLALEHSRKMPKMEVMQLPNAGYEDAIEYLIPGSILCNARGVHDASTAELAIGLAITARRGFADFMVAQSKGEWAHKRYPSFSDSKIGIVGWGSIGQTLAHNLSSFDVEVIGFSRSGKDGALTMDKLDALLPSLDIVILVLPLNDESKNLFDARRLALLKDGATIVNVARGPIINSEALIAELNSGRITAGLDVTDPEPLPLGHPLWSAKNCIIAPHVGGDSTAFNRRGKKLVEDQIARYAKGEELINIVARG